MITSRTGRFGIITGLLPLWGDAEYSESGGLADYALIVQLDAACTVHIVSGGDIAIPLLWERPSGLGRIAVLNTHAGWSTGADAGLPWR